MFELLIVLRNWSCCIGVERCGISWGLVIAGMCEYLKFELSVLDRRQRREVDVAWDAGQDELCLFRHAGVRFDLDQSL